MKRWLLFEFRFLMMMSEVMISLSKLKMHEIDLEWWSSYLEWFENIFDAKFTWFLLFYASLGVVQVDGATPARQNWSCWGTPWGVGPAPIGAPDHQQLKIGEKSVSGFPDCSDKVLVWICMLLLKKILKNIVKEIQISIKIRIFDDEVDKLWFLKNMRTDEIDLEWRSSCFEWFQRTSNAKLKWSLLFYEPLGVNPKGWRFTGRSTLARKLCTQRAVTSKNW